MPESWRGYLKKGVFTTVPSGYRTRAPGVKAAPKGTPPLRPPPLPQSLDPSLPCDLK